MTNLTHTSIATDGTPHANAACSVTVHVYSQHEVACGCFGPLLKIASASCATMSGSTHLLPVCGADCKGMNKAGPHWAGLPLRFKGCLLVAGVSSVHK